MYKKVLLKVSGEFFQGQGALDVDRIEAVVQEIKVLRDAGVKVACVTGAGNIMRGRNVEGEGYDMATAHFAGMLGAVVNGLMLKMVLDKNNIPARLISTFDLPGLADPHGEESSRVAYENGEVLIAGGTGKPFFTTDTAAVKFALEVGAEVVLKGTHVDGVYDSDPRKNKDAKRFDKLTFEEVLSKSLAVMDATAFEMAQENTLPIIVFKWETGNSLRIVSGEDVGTVVGG